jgi:hypothetical protein
MGAEDEELPDLNKLIDQLDVAGMDADQIAGRLADQMGHNVGYILTKVAEARPDWLAGLEKDDKALMLAARLYDGEKDRERRRRRIRAELDAEDRADEVSGEAEGRMVDGADFILSVPTETPAVWGHGNAVAWAEGEALTLTGTPGVGKTTLAGQVVRARLVGGKVLGMPVKETSSRVLYLAMDRPQQIARALARTLRDLPAEALAEKLRVWKGPPLADVAARPEILLEMAKQAGADTVVVDSLKDAAVGLSADDVGAAYNRARQMLLAHGVEVLELHHMVKRNANGKEPTELADVYGSAWITAGAGSVVLLIGKAGDPVVSWRHLKQPAEEVGPFLVAHDHTAGRSHIQGEYDVLDAARLAGTEGLTAKGTAEQMFQTAKPSAAEVAKARRKLDAYVRAEKLQKIDGDDATQRAARWLLAEHDPSEAFADDEDDDLI